MHVDIYRQRSPGIWEFSSYSAGSVVELASVNFSFEIDRLYEDAGFEPEE